jgi:HK97 family phage portal protein
MKLPAFVRGIVASLKAAPKQNGTWTPIGPGSGGIDERTLLQRNREWVYVAADKNATSVKGVRFKVMQFEASDDDKEVFDGPLVEFLSQPSPDYTGKDFIYLTALYKELTGNAFWELVTKTSIAPLLPTDIAPVLEDGKFLGYRAPGPRGTQRVITREKMLHDRYIDPARPYWGVGKLQKIGKWVDTSEFLTDFMRNFFVNGSIFGGFLKTEEESVERIKLIRAGLSNDHQGVQNAHKIGVLPKGNEYQAAGTDLGKMQTGESDDRFRDKILAAFGVPKSVLGIVTDVNRANAEATEYGYAKNTVKPIVDDLIEFMNVRIAPLLDPTGKTYFAYDDFIPRNEEIDIKRRESALAKHAYMTVNEVRAEAGLPPVSDGDEIPEPLPAPEPGGDKPEKGKARQMMPLKRTVEARSAAITKPVPRHVRRVVTYERDIDGLADQIAKALKDAVDPDVMAHKSFVSRVEAYEGLVAGKVREFNGKQRNAVIQNLSHIVKAVAKSDLFDMEAEVAAMVDFVSPLLKGLITEQAIAEYLAQGFEGEFDQAASPLSSIVDRAVKRLARSYNKTTATLLRNTLNEGIENNEDLSQLAVRVNTVFDFSDAYRAAAVARTETFYIANEGSREAYRQSGVVKTLRWYTAEDERTCEFCAPEHGRAIGVNETFYPKGYELTGKDGGTLALNYRTIDVPPLHTNCRCFIRPAEIDVT